jgi:hypothetical protein
LKFDPTLHDDISLPTWFLVPYIYQRKKGPIPNRNSHFRLCFVKKRRQKYIPKKSPLLEKLRNYKIKLFQRSVEILVDQSALYTTAQVN